MKFGEFGKQAAFALVIGITTGAVLPAVYGETNFLNGWLASSAVLAPAVFALMRAWACLGKGRALAWMMATAFLLRLCLGVFLNFAFPAWGYDTPSQRAGYTTQDAFRRDIEAVDLARSNQYLFTTFQQGFDTDQYGGMVLVSAWVYRYLSPDAHRSYLILILAAWIAALGIPFMVDVVRKTWDERVALWAGWIYVLYPDAVFFSSSQMREPFLIGLSAVAFWGAHHLGQRRLSAWMALLGGLVGIFLISGMVGLVVGAMLVAWWAVRYSHTISRQKQGNKTSGLLLGGLILAVGLVILLAVGSWLRTSIAWDTLLTAKESGWVARLIEGRPGWFQLTFITLYGLVQPVLPGTLVEPTIPLFRILMIVRALGWYILAPLLIFGILRVFKAPSGLNRRYIVLIGGIIAFWLLISSIRAGGDQWDNPRYRTILMVWISTFAAWGLDQAARRGAAWLWRILLVEGIFVVFFTNWYVSRYTQIWLRLPFWDMIFWIAGLSVLVVAIGLIWDHRWWLRRKLARRDIHE